MQKDADSRPDRLVNARVGKTGAFCSEGFCSTTVSWTSKQLLLHCANRVEIFRVKGQLEESQTLLNRCDFKAGQVWASK